MVSVLSDKAFMDNYYIYFILLRQILTAISAFQRFQSPSAGFLSLVRVTHFTHFEKGILSPKS